MKILSPALAAHLAGGATTLAHLWRVERRDGVVLGFTDHDRDLAVDGVAYRATTGFTASSIEDQADLAVSNLDVSGALASEAITEADIAAGRYDGAEVVLSRVNWADTGQVMELRRGTIGRITRGTGAFTAELRGLAAALDQPVGRRFTRDCAWSLGDARCRVALDGLRTAGTAVALAGRFGLTVESEAAATTLGSGTLEVTGGAAGGLSADIASAAAAGGGLLALRLALPVPAGLAPGDGVVLAPGCDRRFSTCRDRFANAANFGGFPHMPGNDFALKIARRGDDNDGGKLT